MPVPDAHLLLAMGRAHAPIHVEHDASHPSGSPSLPRAIQDKLLIAISESRKSHRNSVHYSVAGLASVLWTPPGAKQFCSRYAWGRRKVAYRSQFLSVYDRGHAGQAKIKARLIGDLDPDDWDLPPKPKWIRWRTYIDWSSALTPTRT
jgi:hypothetical protein